MKAASTKVVVFTDCDIVHTSSVFMGLQCLTDKGIIDLDVQTPLSAINQQEGRFTVFLEAANQENDQGSLQKICIDLHDSSSYLATQRLEKCDLYFKRNYNASALSDLAETERRKIRPYGPDFACRNKNDGHILSRYVGSILSFIHWRKTKIRPGMTKDCLFYIFTRILRYKDILPVESYEQGELFTNGKPVIYFNTRCFPENDETVKLNQSRAEIIRKLKKLLGNQFVGGFVPGACAEQKYPDCITNSPYSLAGHIKTMKSMPICIYTNGLDHSLAWKFGEYMAAGRCIVSERLHNDLAFPLEDKKNIFYFATADECVEICKNLINSPQTITLAQEMVRNYYLAYIRPDVNIYRILFEQAL